MSSTSRDLEYSPTLDAFINLLLWSGPNIAVINVNGSTLSFSDSTKLFPDAWNANNGLAVSLTEAQCVLAGRNQSNGNIGQAAPFTVTPI